MVQDIYLPFRQYRTDQSNLIYFNLSINLLIEIEKLREGLIILLC